MKAASIAEGSDDMDMADKCYHVLGCFTVFTFEGLDFLGAQKKFGCFTSALHEADAENDKITSVDAKGEVYSGHDPCRHSPSVEMAANSSSNWNRGGHHDVALANLHGEIALASFHGEIALASFHGEIALASLHGEIALASLHDEIVQRADVDVMMDHHRA